jgi:hypothetical protein
MLAGVGRIDAVLFAIAADEGDGKELSDPPLLGVRAGIRRLTRRISSTKVSSSCGRRCARPFAGPRSRR